MLLAGVKIMKKPSRNQLGGYSLSEFKTYLKTLGHKVPRNMSSTGYVTQYEDRLYRWRWLSEEGFMVDRSEPLEMFDRWANSIEQSYPFSSSYKEKV